MFFVTIILLRLELNHLNPRPLTVTAFKKRYGIRPGRGDRETVVPPDLQVVLYPNARLPQIVGLTPSSFHDVTVPSAA